MDEKQRKEIEDRDDSEWMTAEFIVLVFTLVAFALMNILMRAPL